MSTQTPERALPSAPQAGAEAASRPRLSRSVLLRLLAVAMAAVFSVHLIGAVVIAETVSRAEQRRVDERLSAVLDARARVLAAPLWKMQYETLTAILQELVSDPAVVAATIYDDTGTAVASARFDGAGGDTTMRTQSIMYQDGNIRTFAGRLEVVVTRAPIVAAFWTSLWNALLLALLATAAIAIGIFVATQRYIGRPLSLIASAIDRSRLDGRRHRVNLDSDDEFGAVARAFNAMQIAAERNEHALQIANRRLDFLALHDELTGLPNRRSFEEQLRATADSMTADAGTLAVHFIDLDDFKAVNDTLGHAAGDKLLRHVGRQLRECAGDGGFVARFGGDEFVVLQTQVVDEAGARAYAERLMEALRQPCTLYGTTIRTGASVGVALMDGSAGDVARILSLADLALYEAKRESRGTISFLTSATREEHNRRRRMEIDLKVALEENQFLLYFQPQVSLADGKPVGLEALVRWRHPVDGILSPAAFLPLVEELGLGTRLGHVIINEACEAARQLEQQGHSGLRIAVNLSGAQILDRGLVRLFEDKIAQYGLSASTLEAEITEVAVIRDPHNAKEILSDLRRLGVSVALDDFGTGYSSLAYLRHFPIDRIKLDRSFVQELPEFKETVAIVRAIFTLSQALGMELVAEGVERDVEAEFLRQEGIGVAQGYLYCTPQPLDQIAVWLDLFRRGGAPAKSAASSAAAA